MSAQGTGIIPRMELRILVLVSKWSTTRDNYFAIKSEEQSDVAFLVKITYRQTVLSTRSHLRIRRLLVLDE